jgi:hypothetical protein
VFLEFVEVEDGDYGTTIEPRFRVLEPGAWKLLEVVEQSGSWEIVEADAGQYLDSSGQPMSLIPVVWYSAEKDGFGRGGLPMRQLAEHSLEHFRTRSDLAEKTHKVAMPVPVRIGDTPAAPGQPPKPLVLGPNSVVDLPEGGSFTFAEPSAASLAEQRAQVEHIEQLIQLHTLNFQFGGSNAKTATQVAMEGAETQAGIKRMAEAKGSVLQQLMAIWCLYTGEDLPEDAGIAMASTIYDKPLEAQEIAQLHTLAGGVELISQESAIEELQRGGVNRATTSVEEELKRIKREEPQRQALLGVNAEMGGIPSSQTADDLDDVQPDAEDE